MAALEMRVLLLELGAPLLIEEDGDWIGSRADRL
jgi:hypothetical protein